MITMLRRRVVRIFQLFHRNNHHIDMTCRVQHLGCYLEGQCHSMTLQQNRVWPKTFLFEVGFYNYFWQATSLCLIPIRRTLPGSDRLLFKYKFFSPEYFAWNEATNFSFKLYFIADCRRYLNKGVFLCFVSLYQLETEFSERYLKRLNRWSSMVPLSIFLLCTPSTVLNKYLASLLLETYCTLSYCHSCE